MKTNFLAVCLALALLSTLLPARADTPLRKVTVTGGATIKIAPDEMNWSVAVSAEAATADAAKKIHDASLTTALAYLKGLGGAIKDLQTDGIRINKINYGAPVPIGDKAHDTSRFSCGTIFTFTLTDFDQYGPIIDTLAKLEGFEVQSVEYASSKEESMQTDVLKNALVNAHDKASELAQVAGCTIDKPLEILEGTPNIGPRPMMMMAKSFGGGTPAAVPGQIEISGTVTATYDLFSK